MPFWVGWELWQRMSFVLLGLILIVFMLSFSVLAYNRRRTRRHAAAEAQSHQHEEEGVLNETKSNDIPFGVRALERGIQVEGIWNSNANTPFPSPCRAGTPASSQPSSPSTSRTTFAITTNEPQQSGLAYPWAPRVNSPDPRRVSRAMSGKSFDKDKRQSGHVDAPQAAQLNRPEASERKENEVVDEPDLHAGQGDIGSRKPSTVKSQHEDLQRSETKAPSQRSRHSTEEFRRVISQIFKDNIQASTSEPVQLNPIPLGTSPK